MIENFKPYFIFKIFIFMQNFTPKKEKGLDFPLSSIDLF